MTEFHCVEALLPEQFKAVCQQADAQLMVLSHGLLLLIVLLSVCPALYANMLVQLCEPHQPVQACHSQLALLQPMRFTGSLLSCLSLPLPMADGGHLLA